MFRLITVTRTLMRIVLPQSFSAPEASCQSSLKDPKFAPEASLCFTTTREAVILILGDGCWLSQIC